MKYLVLIGCLLSPIPAKAIAIVVEPTQQYKQGELYIYEYALADTVNLRLTFSHQFDTVYFGTMTFTEPPIPLRLRMIVKEKRAGGFVVTAHLFQGGNFNFLTTHKDFDVIVDRVDTQNFEIISKDISDWVLSKKAYILGDIN